MVSRSTTAVPGEVPDRDDTRRCRSAQAEIGRTATPNVLQKFYLLARARHELLDDGLGRDAGQGVILAFPMSHDLARPGASPHKRGQVRDAAWKAGYLFWLLEAGAEPIWQQPEARVVAVVLHDLLVTWPIPVKQGI